MCSRRICSTPLSRSSDSRVTRHHSATSDLTVIRATQFDDDAVAVIDELADLALWVTSENNPDDWPVRDAAKRLRAALPAGR